MRYQQVEAAIAPRVRERPPPYGSVRTQPRVLLVEDNALARRVATRALAGAFEVSSVEDGEHALRLLRPGAFDVIVSDHHMAAMTGLELLELVRLCAQQPAPS